MIFNKVSIIILAFDIIYGNIELVSHFFDLQLVFLALNRLLMMFFVQLFNSFLVWSILSHILWLLIENVNECIFDTLALKAGLVSLPVPDKTKVWFWHAITWSAFIVEIKIGERTLWAFYFLAGYNNCSHIGRSCWTLWAADIFDLFNCRYQSYA